MRLERSAETKLLRDLMVFKEEINMSQFAEVRTD